ncbi:hypothetical protein [Mesonia aestuariivivens]|uniref:DUF3024 domain-containing protein n=1 Tax=Mesonia aestuariivivens TaxID=2796128 RepID=A0ABS6W5D3_9FLAO|nr:hypothetical protein [Mesonia aestuariivivens]MBW2962324.1 hypothetical protein [Mesonia aestuariivivens]
MKKPTFVNTHPEAIKETLIKVGKVRLAEACKMKGLEMPKRMERFKVTWYHNRAFLNYSYSVQNNKRDYETILVLHNEELPTFGWIIEWESY